MNPGEQEPLDKPSGKSSATKRVGEQGGFERMAEAVRTVVEPTLRQVPVLGHYLPEAEEYPRLPMFSEYLVDYTEVLQRREQYVANAYWFNILVIGATVGCAVMLGVQLDTSFGLAFEDRFHYFLMDICFAIFFFVEMLLRQNQLGWDYFFDPWNLYDYVLVVLNFSDMMATVTSEDGGFQLAAAMRVFRILRIASYVRGIKAFFGMWLLMQGLLNALKPLLWTGLLLVILLYSLSIFAMVIITDDEVLKDQWDLHEFYFGTLQRTILTITQVFTLDVWSDVVRPIMLLRNGPGVALLITSIVVCNLGVLNIIISLMVEKIGQMRLESEAKNGKILSRVENEITRLLHKSFLEAVQNAKSKGDLDRHEYKAFVGTAETSLKFRLLGYNLEEVESFFDIFDVSRNKRLTYEEFVEGLKRVRGTALGLDIVSMISFTKKMSLVAKKNVRRAQRLCRRADVLQERLDAIGCKMQREMGYKTQLNLRRQQVQVFADGVDRVIQTLGRDSPLAKVPNETTAGMCGSCGRAILPRAISQEEGSVRKQQVPRFRSAVRPVDPALFRRLCRH